ncbi:MAG: beta-N-acetylhexosaminidase [Sciscionella sp.]|nr:beta-N-acetylhexosaminidase [Sciscionella sp.]
MQRWARRRWTNRRWTHRRTSIWIAAAVAAVLAVTVVVITSNRQPSQANADGTPTDQANTVTAAQSSTSSTSTSSSAPSSTAPSSTTAPTTPTTSRPAQPKLTPQQLAGQRVIYSYAGYTPPASLLNKIKSGEAAGVIFFGGNIKSDGQIASVTKELENAAAQSPIKAPLLLMTDQEGGEVRRLPGAPTQSEKTIGASADPNGAAAQAGTGAGQNLAGVGMNVNLAPVLDVFRTPGDFDDQYQRSYSQNPSVVAGCGKSFVTAQQATGVAATVKHFPGLGAATATENTDEKPVTLNVSLTDLRDIDEAPYPASISAGVKLVMVSWATYPSIDASEPAGLSSKIVQGELRSRLGFSGVTVTDSLGAGALNPFGSTGNRAVLAAGAGMDLILAASQDYTQGADAETALTNAYNSGQLNQSGFAAATQRVINLRKSLG